MILIRLYFWLYYVYLVIDLFIDWYFIRGCDLITPLRAFWMTIFFLIMMLLKDWLNQIYGEIIYRKKQKIRKILIILLFPHGFDWKLCQSLNINPLQLGVAFLQPLKTFSVFRGYRKATPGYNELMVWYNISSLLSLRC